MATNPPLDMVLAPLHGESRSLGEWLSMFHLVLVVLDPFTNESAWVLPSAVRILTNYGEADCRVAFVVTGTPDECVQFLGPWSRDILTIADADRSVVGGLGLRTLPAIVHLAIDGTVVSAAEGWDPYEWRKVTDILSHQMGWNRPTLPTADDPGPFVGSPALG